MSPVALEFRVAAVAAKRRAFLHQVEICCAVCYNSYPACVPARTGVFRRGLPEIFYSIRIQPVMASAKTQTYPRGTETVLLVEPEPATRTLAAFMLRKQGYLVLEAHNAVEALKIYDEYQGAVDLLLAEALMSRVNGHELADMLRVKDSALRLLFLADVDYVRVASRAAAQKGLSFVPRPFTMAVLARKIREVLDAPVPGLRTFAAGGMAM